MKIKYVRQNSGILTPTPLFHLPEFISLILIYLDFRGGRERESRTYCGKQQANLGFASASQTFNEKSFSRRVFLVMRSFAQEKKSQQAPEMDALERARKVFSWCHKIN